MNTPNIQQQRDEIIRQLGPWTAHNIKLAEGVYTIDEAYLGCQDRIRHLFRIVTDLCNQPLDQLRILDLACLEGMYGIEFAIHGANVVAIEGRQSSVQKAVFARDCLGLKNIEILQGDVRDLSVEQFGSFDVVLCAGILYHLDDPDVFELVENIAKVCKRVAVIDTHFSLTPNLSYDYKGKQYWGHLYHEFNDDTLAEEKEKATLSSLDNPKSFWMTQPSLFRLMKTSGFTSAYECHVPILEFDHLSCCDRKVFVGVKGDMFTIHTNPQANVLPLIEHSEDTEQIAASGYKALVRGLYDQAIALYQAAIELEAEKPQRLWYGWSIRDSWIVQAHPNRVNPTHYWYLGLAYLLADHEAEAQMTWLTALTNLEQEFNQTDYHQSLFYTLVTEATRLQAQGDRPTAWVIRTYAQEFYPDDINNRLHQLSLALICFNEFQPEDLVTSGLLAALEAQPLSLDANLVFSVLRQLKVQFPSHDLITQFEQTAIRHFLSIEQDQPSQ